MKSQSTISTKQKKGLTTAALVIATVLGLMVIDDELSSLRGGYMHQIRMASKKAGRGLSRDLGGGDCEWTEPLKFKDVPADADFEKTLIVGFPSGDKRLAYTQMEALTGLPTGDEWNYVFNGRANAAFIKSNYPHTSGTWSWDGDADQVVLVVQNIRRTLVEFSSIAWQLSDESLGDDKVTICHRTSSVKNPWVEIKVASAAVQAHVDHGDLVGECGENFKYLGPIADPRSDQVTVCHYTACDKAPWIELKISSRTLEVHMSSNTQDFLGECEQNPEYAARKYVYNNENGPKIFELLRNPGTPNGPGEPRGGPTTPTPPGPGFYPWRDNHVFNQIFEWGWLIDFWMEGGLMREPFSHQEICPVEFELFSCPPSIKSGSDKVSLCHRTASPKNPWIQLEISESAVQAHLNHGDFIGDCEQANDPDFVAPEPNFQRPRVLAEGDACVQQYDPNCSKITGGCRPKLVISADKLRDATDGPAETRLIGDYLVNSPKMSNYVINESTWDCIWDKTTHEGPQPYADSVDTPNFSAGMLETMIEEVTRIRDKYRAMSGDDNARRLVGFMDEYLAQLNIELGEVNSGVRTLTAEDIFMPGERKALSFD